MLCSRNPAVRDRGLAALLLLSLISMPAGRGSSLLAEPQVPMEKDPQSSSPSENSHSETILVTRERLGRYRPRSTPRLKEAIDGIISRTNEFRKTEMLPPLQRNELLEKTAQEFADYMARTGKYGHEADDRTAVERVRDSKYQFCYVGENIAMQFREIGFATGPLTKAFFLGWKNSPPHRANMLHLDVTETGVGIAQSSQTGAFFAVQLVGRPLSQGCRPIPTPASPLPETGPAQTPGTR